MSACDLCDGTLLERVGKPSSEGTQCVRPCPRCLTVPATDEIREMARECEWFDKWEALHMAGLSDGSPWVQRPFRTYNPVVPAYLPAGFDLLARVLARRCRGWVGAGVGGVTFTEMDDTWWVCGDEGDQYWSHLLEVHGCAVEAPYLVPALATIPDGAPADLRAARALVLCVETIANGRDDG